MQPRADPTRFYVLTVRNAAPAKAAEAGAGRLKITLQPVELPAYLKDECMVVRIGANGIHRADFDRWAEPLDQAIRRVISATLSPGISVETNPHGEKAADFGVTLRVSACEGVRVEHGNSSARFAITWEISPVSTNAEAIRSGGFAAGAVSWDGLDYGKLAGLLSDATAEAGRALSADITADAGRPTSDKRVE